MRHRFTWSTLCVLLSALFITACKSHTAPVERYPFHGLVLQVDLRAHQAMIQHDDIPGLMKGMTMPFTIRDERVLSSLKVGDVVQATLVKQDYGAWLEDVKVVDHKNLDFDKPARSQVPHRPSPGEAVPDFLFTGQDGKPLHVAQFRGRPLLITFIYTRCPLPQFCPRMNATMLAVARKLQDPQLQLLSVSFDPEHDTPAVLRRYSRHWREDLPAAERGNWQFVTPPKGELHRLLSFFGLTAQKNGDLITHSLSTTLVDPEGKVASWYPGNEWSPDDIADELARLREPGAQTTSARARPGSDAATAR
jgi:protein SCO1/2